MLGLQLANSLVNCLQVLWYRCRHAGCMQYPCRASERMRPYFASIRSYSFLFVPIRWNSVGFGLVRRDAGASGSIRAHAGVSGRFVVASVSGLSVCACLLRKPLPDGTLAGKKREGVTCPERTTYNVWRPGGRLGCRERRKVTPSRLGLCVPHDALFARVENGMGRTAGPGAPLMERVRSASGRRDGRGRDGYRVRETEGTGPSLYRRSGGGCGCRGPRVSGAGRRTRWRRGAARRAEPVKDSSGCPALRGR